MAYKYVNEQYPILSFLYAVFAGGENALNCTETEPFMSAYLTGPGGRAAQTILRKIPNNGNNPLQPTDAQWDQLLALLKEELEQPSPPQPMW